MGGREGERAVKSLDCIRHVMLLPSLSRSPPSPRAICRRRAFETSRTRVARAHFPKRNAGTVELSPLLLRPPAVADKLADTYFYVSSRKLHLSLAPIAPCRAVNPAGGSGVSWIEYPKLGIRIHPRALVCHFVHADNILVLSRRNCRHRCAHSRSPR